MVIHSFFPAVTLLYTVCLLSLCNRSDSFRGRAITTRNYRQFHVAFRRKEQLGGKRGSLMTSFGESDGSSEVNFSPLSAKVWKPKVNASAPTPVTKRVYTTRTYNMPVSNGGWSRNSSAAASNTVSQKNRPRNTQNRPPSKIPVGPPVTWKPLTAEEKSALLGLNLRDSERLILVKVIDALNAGQSAKFVSHLKALAKEMSGNSCTDDMLPMLSRIVPGDLCAAQVADVIWSLGGLGFSATDANHRQLLYGMLERFCELEVVNSREVTTALVGFSKMRFRWSLLQKETQEDIIMAVGAVAATLNDREVGNLLHALSKLAVPWSDFPKTTQASIMESFVKHSKLLVSQQGSMAIYSLGIMGLSLENLHPAMRDHIYTVSLSVLGESKSNIHRSVTQQASNVIYGLGKMNAKWNELPPYVRDGIMAAVVNAMGYMNEQEVANTIYSLGCMEASWLALPMEARDTIEKTIIQRFEKMIPQGISNTIYGMGLLGAQWPDMTPEYQEAVLRVIVSSFSKDASNAKDHRNERFVSGGGVGGQAVANVIYSLGVSGAVWKDLPAPVQAALVNALAVWGPELKSQELSNTCYGLGQLRANYSQLSVEAVQTLEANFDRVKMNMNEQEVCSTLHGYAKMGAQWDQLPEYMKRIMLVSIAALSNIGSLCLACTVYSLGLLGATWDELPTRVKKSFLESSRQQKLHDQTIANVIYGLGMLKVDWEGLDKEFRDVLVESLGRSDVFGANMPQHIANSIYGLSKMDASWSMLPTGNIEGSIIRGAKYFSPQEISNTFYGLATIDTPWVSLSDDCRKELCDALLRTVGEMTTQETANVMYSIALSTFDVPFVSPSSKSKKAKMSPQQSQLWSAYRVLLETFKQLDPADYSVENYDQYGMFFQLLKAIPGGKELVVDVLGYFPKLSGPCGTVPSKLHARTIHAMLRNLDYIKYGFDVTNEFNGLDGVFPVDAAVYFKDELIAFIEIDGEFHYRQLGQVLRRKDRMKEFLYRHEYPNIPLFRIRDDQCAVLGVHRAGQELATWITQVVDLSPPNFQEIEAEEEDDADI